ncbi:MAG: NAD(P)H-dependent oxidoreductase [Alphaproteobacteria bacterium]|nr:NAD(P)H-dependent oxidoreductase [Alphaproteobacteria bacterium]
MPRVKVLALCGSLRVGSTNLALLQAAKILAPPDMEFSIWNRQAGLPHFTPDLEGLPPPEVQKFRDHVGVADGLIIACPEYARGLPGAFKNALDWLVGGETFINKPFAQWNASPRAAEAQNSLRLVLETMSGRCLEEAALALPLIKQEVTGRGLAAHPEWGPQISLALVRLGAALRA